MSQPGLFDEPHPRYQDLWGGKRLTPEEFDHLFHNDPKTIRGLDAIKGVGEYKPGNSDMENWYGDNISYTNDQMYRDLNHVLRVHRGKFPEDEPSWERMRRQQGAYKNVYSDPEEIKDVIDDMDYGHTGSRMHGLTALHRGIHDAEATFGDASYGDLTGHTFVEHAPMSTSPSDVVASSFRNKGKEPAHIKILAPRGTPAMSTMWHGGKDTQDVDDGESEVILGRGGRFHVVHDEPGAYPRQIWMQYLGPDTSIHGHTDLENLQHHDPSERFDLNMDKLRENAAKQATEGDFDKYMKAGYQYEAEPTEHGEANVKFFKPYYDRGIHHMVEYEDVNPDELPYHMVSVIRPLMSGPGANAKNWHSGRPNHVEYLDYLSDKTPFEQAQDHLAKHPDDSYFLKKSGSLLALAAAGTWDGE